MKNPRRLLLLLIAAVTLSLAAVGGAGSGLVSSSGAQSAGGAFTWQTFANAHGARAYRLYVPSGYKSGRMALVVMLHGCTQTADDFAAGTKMNAIAERETFIVVYPEQPAAANASRCWNWFEPAHQARDAGEPSLIAGITQAVSARYRIDRSRVYVAGMSAGGAMTAIMRATYPDLYAAIGVSAGLEYKAATDLASALAAQQTGGPDPDQQGRLAFAAGGSAARVVPAIVFHGQLDATVAVKNGHQLIAQWAQTDDLADDGDDNGSITNHHSSVTAGAVPGGYTYSRSLYTDAKRAVVLEKWIVETMTHKWSGGSTAGSYTDPKGPDASEEMWRFFHERKNQ